MIEITLRGFSELTSRLSKLERVPLDRVVRDTAAEIYNRTRLIGAVVGGTPKRTGELRQSVRMTGSGCHYEVGYLKEYAPHVEFGHRLVAWGRETGKHVPGQFYLKKNVSIQRKELNKRVKELLENA